MYATSSPVPQQERLFPSHDGRPSRPYHVPVYRVTLVRESRLPHTQPQLRSSRDAAVLFRQYLGEVDREHFMVAMLDQKHKVIGLNTVSMGALHKQHDIKQLECELGSPGVLEFSCTHPAYPGQQWLENLERGGGVHRVIAS